MAKLYKIALVIAGFILIVIASTGIHTNHNDGHYVYGRGFITVNECHKVDESYICTGAFQQHGGMVEVARASIKTNTPYKSGQIIDDLFPHYTFKGNEIAGVKLETGATRRSVTHNIVFIITGLIGVGLVLFALLSSLRLNKKT